MDRLRFLINHILWSMPTVLLAVLLTMGGRYLWQKRRALRPVWAHEAGVCLLAAYLALLFSVTWELGQLWVSLCYGWPLPAPRWFQGGVGWPLVTEISSLWDGWMLAGNIALFCPLGFLLPLLWWRERAAQVVLSGAAVSLLIESVQFVIGRTFDAADLVNNSIGTGLGWAAWYAVRRRYPEALARFRPEYSDG